MATPLSKSNKRHGCMAIAMLTGVVSLVDGRLGDANSRTRGFAQDNSLADQFAITPWGAKDNIGYRSSGYSDYDTDVLTPLQESTIRTHTPSGSQESLSTNEELVIASNSPYDTDSYITFDLSQADFFDAGIDKRLIDAKLQLFSLSPLQTEVSFDVLLVDEYGRIDRSKMWHVSDSKVDAFSCSYKSDCWIELDVTNELLSSAEAQQTDYNWNPNRPLNVVIRASVPRRQNFVGSFASSRWSGGGRYGPKLQLDFQRDIPNTMNSYSSNIRPQSQNKRPGRKHKQKGIKGPRPNKVYYANPGSYANPASNKGPITQYYTYVVVDKEPDHVHRKPTQRPTRRPTRKPVMQVNKVKPNNMQVYYVQTAPQPKPKKPAKVVAIRGPRKKPKKNYASYYSTNVIRPNTVVVPAYSRPNTVVVPSYSVRPATSNVIRPNTVAVPAYSRPNTVVVPSYSVRPANNYDIQPNTVAVPAYSGGQNYGPSGPNAGGGNQGPSGPGHGGSNEGPIGPSVSYGAMTGPNGPNAAYGQNQGPNGPVAGGGNQGPNGPSHGGGNEGPKGPSVSYGALSGPEGPQAHYNGQSGPSAGGVSYGAQSGPEGPQANYNGQSGPSAGGVSYDGANGPVGPTANYNGQGANGQSRQGTNKFYMNYSVGKCVKDCDGDGCGGVANFWDQIFDDLGACCTQMNFWNSDCMN